MSEDPVPRSEPVALIEDGGDGTYALSVDGSPAVKIDWVAGHRQMRWMIYGPCDLDRSLAIARGFIHLTALLGNEQRAYDRPPEVSEVPVERNEEPSKWRRKTTPRSKP